MARNTPPQPSLEPSDRRQDILNAALACATVHGVEAISIEGLREHCNASVGSIYHHFGSKEGVVAALFFAILADQSRSMQAHLDASQGAEGGVRALVSSYLEWVESQPHNARFLFQARSPVAAGPRAAELALAAQQRNQTLVAWFEPHRQTGAVRALPCALMPSLVMGPVQSYCRAWLSAPDALPPPSTYRTELADAAWRAVRASKRAP